MISPDPRGDFEIHLTAMLNLDWNDAPYDVAGEMKKIKETKILCLFGDGEEISRIRVSNRKVFYFYTKFRKS